MKITAVPRIGSWCSGYRGLDMAVESVLGGTTAWVSDIDPGASRILAHHCPTVPNLGDLTTTDWQAVINEHGPGPSATASSPSRRPPLSDSSPLAPDSAPLSDQPPPDPAHHGGDPHHPP